MEEQKLKEKMHLLLFVPLSPKPLFCSIAPQTPIQTRADEILTVDQRCVLLYLALRQPH